MSWRICSRNRGSADGESRRMEPNGGKRVPILESRTKRVVTICRSQQEVLRRATFIVARIARKNSGASEESAARSRAWRVVANITAATSIPAFDYVF